MSSMILYTYIKSKIIVYVYYSTSINWWLLIYFLYNICKLCIYVQRCFGDWKIIIHIIYLFIYNL